MIEDDHSWTFHNFSSNFRRRVKSSSCTGASTRTSPVHHPFSSSVLLRCRYRRSQARRGPLQRNEFYLAEGPRLAHLGSWTLDPAGFEYGSPELFRMHVLDPDGKPPTIQEYLDCVHPQDRESMANLIHGTAKGSAFDATKRIVRPNGEVRYIRCVGAVENKILEKARWQRR